MNNTLDNTTVIIPIYNEKQNIELLLHEIINKYFGINILVVNDGSTDDVIDILIQNKYKNFIYINNNINLGLTYSIIKGINYCNTDWFIVMDGDFQHPINNLINFINLFTSGSDIVIGSRKNIKFDKNIFREIISNIGNFLINIKLNKKKGEYFKDPLTGFFGGKTFIFKQEILNNKKNFSNGGYKFLFEFLKVVNFKDYKISTFLFIFGKRKFGFSKLGFKEYINFIMGLIK